MARAAILALRAAAAKLQAASTIPVSHRFGSGFEGHLLGCAPRDNIVAVPVSLTPAPTVKIGRFAV